jgi:hypothetical protein
MNALLLKFLAWLKQKNHMIILIVLLLLFGMWTTIYFQRQSIAKWKDKYQTEAKLKNALVDSVTNYQNVHKEWVAEKLTIQESIKNLEKINGQLTDFQKELLLRVKEIEKNNKIISAALIETKVLVQKLVGDSTETVVDTTKKTIQFGDYSKIGNKEISYQFTIGKVLPAFSGIKPTLMIDSIYFPNKSFVEFHYKKDKNTEYPISFSVSNSNGYFKTVNIDSYAIPDIKYGGSKFDKWLAKNGKMLMYIGIGAGGATGLWLLAK